MAKKEHIPWNKGLKGKQWWHNISGFRPGWNKGLSAPWAKNNPQTFQKGQIPWNKGKHTGNYGNGFKKGIIPWNKGKKSLIYGENHWNWKGGKTSEDNKIRHSIEYRNWQQAVYRKDKWICRLCGIHCQKKGIIAHHISCWNSFPKKRFEIKNGIVLCKRCHKVLHSLGVDDILYGNIITHQIYVQKNANKEKETIEI